MDKDSKRWQQYRKERNQMLLMVFCIVGFCVAAMLYGMVTRH